MNTITVPSDFFRAELRVYGNWREAFARELLQNAADARPSRIDVTFGTTDDGHGRVVFTDDGYGMSREVLEEVFFALGRTTKSGPGSIGGFGRARIIICFAQIRYEIRTGYLLISGSGGQYTITEVAQYQRGCQFTIDLIDESVDAVRNAFTYLLGRCSLPVPVSVDGQVQTPRALPSRARRVMRDDDGNAWGRVYVDERRGGYLYVRVGGLLMFTRYLDGNDDVILELDPARSREVLTASRDQLHTVYGEQVDRFVADLSKNKRRALAEETPRLNVHVGGGGFMATDAPGTRTAAPVPAASSAPEGDGAWVQVTPANEAAFANQTRLAWDGLDVDALADLAPEIADQSRPLGFDVYLLADRADARVRKLARAWDPTGWDATTGLRRRALLLAWKQAVAVAVDTLVRARPGLERVMWTVGWTFDEDVNAVHTTYGDGHVLALNPVDAAGATRFHVSRRSDRQRLLSFALHEACHVAVGDHDEDFAAVLTELMATVDLTTADRSIRDAARAA